MGGVRRGKSRLNGAVALKGRHYYFRIQVAGAFGKAYMGLYWEAVNVEHGHVEEACFRHKRKIRTRRKFDFFFGTYHKLQH